MPPAPDAGKSAVLGAGANEGGGKKAHAAADSDEKWREAAIFWRDHSQHKWAAYLKLPEAAQAELRAQLTARYNELSKLPANSKIQAIELDRVRIEDDLFYELSQMKRQHVQGDRYSEGYLRAVRELVENRMKERAARLENLQNVVSDDNKLRNDPKKFSNFIRERARQIERNGLGGGAAAAQGGRRRMPGQPATAESEEEVLPPSP